MLKGRRSFLVVLVVGVIVFSWSENHFSPFFQTCVNRESNQQTLGDTKDKGQIVGEFIGAQVICTIRLVDKHNGLFAVLTAIAIAGFTWMLYIATSEQGRLTLQTINLARDEFNATHRPEIVVHSIEIAHDVTADPHHPLLGAQVTYFNKGPSAATIVEVQASIVARRLPLQSGIQPPTIHNERTKVGSGMPGTFPIWSDLDDREARLVSGGSAVVCIGVIVYEDASGNRRRTAFCRQYERGLGAERWEHIEGASEYEYNY